MERMIFRASLAALVAVMLMFSNTGFAQEKCMPVKTPKQKLLLSDAPGYEVVTVRVQIPTPPGIDPEIAAQDGLFRFALVGGSRKLALDLNRWIRHIEQCTSVYTSEGRTHQRKMTWIQVIGAVAGHGYAGYTLASDVLLPTEFAAAQPYAFTKLDSGVFYVGTWSMEERSRILTLRPAKSTSLR